MKKKKQNEVEEEKNTKEVKSKKNMKKIFLYTMLSFLLILVIIAIVIFAIYFNFNYKLGKKLVESNDEKNIEITYKFYILVMSNKNKEYIKENKKNLIINYNNYAITLDYNALPKYIEFNINTDVKKSELEKFKGLDVLNIDFSEFKAKESISKFKINIDRNVFKNKNVDIYKIINTNENVNIVKKAENVENGNVTFEVYDKNLKPEENSNKFFVCYVPLQDITLSKSQTEIKRTQSEKIEYKLIPENATNTNIITKYDNEALEISTDLNFVAKKEGEYKVEISVQDESIVKEVLVKILEVASKIEVDKNSISIEIGKEASINAKVVPDNAVNKEVEWTSSNENIAKVDQNGKITTNKVGKCEIKVKTKEEPIVESVINVEVKPKPVIYVATKITQAPQASNSNGLTYIQGILVVNKKYSVPSTYNPGVNQTALAAFNQMKAAAANEGVSLWIVSGFRSYTTQSGLYSRYVSVYGQASADTFSARPGHSEHQIGLAFDLNSINDNFGNTKEGIWLAQNCHKFGFIIRYPKGKQAITGYKYEPWHVRYLGTDVATKVFNSGLCLEEYLGI